MSPRTCGDRITSGTRGRAETGGIEVIHISAGDEHYVASEAAIKAPDHKMPAGRCTRSSWPWPPPPEVWRINTGY